MEMLPPAGVPELATKADLAVLKTDFDGLRREFGGLQREFGGLRRELDGFRVEMRAEIGSLEARMGERIEQQTVRFLRWSAAIAALSLTVAELAGRVG